MPRQKFTRGFTIIEIIVVIAILAILLAVVLAVTAPRPEPKLPNNLQRRSDVVVILHGITKYRQAHGGELPAGITAEPRPIASGSPDIVADLCKLIAPEFINELPFDPATGVLPSSGKCWQQSAVYISGYTVQVNDGKVTVVAPAAEDSEVIKATR